MNQLKKIYRTTLLIILIALAGSCAKKNTAQNEEANGINTDFLNSLPKITAQMEIIQKEIRLNGRIVPDEAKQASVHALVSGRISKVNIELGDYVRKGETLAVLKSAEVAGAGNDLAQAKSNLEIAQKAMDTSKDLYESKLLSEQEYLAAKAEYRKALSELEKSEYVYSITGGENSNYVLKSPIDGYVIAKNITNNTEVRSDMAEPLFSIADLSTIWVLADVFEVDIPNIKLTQNVKINTLSNPEKIYTAQIDKIYNVLDPEKRSMKIRASLNNAGKEFMPGMFVSVLVNFGGEEKAVAVPNDAIVFENNENFVIVLKGDNQPEIRPVREIYRTGNKSYLEGVKPGETVITGSQVFLYNALRE